MEKQTIKIISVNISREKGTVKQAVPEIKLTPTGIEGDAHAGKWHRMVSLLGIESFRRFEVLAGRKLNFGEFAENITTEGIELVKTKPFDRFINKNIELEITQIGKKCHGNSCAIYREVGNCVMPKEGIFVRVIRGGTLKAGDTLEYIPKVYRFYIITLSDRASRGEYEDLSGPAIEKQLQQFFGEIPLQTDRTIIPDDANLLIENINMAVNKGYDCIITTGGTGIGPRDITPDVVASLLDKQIPGIMDFIRMKYGAEKPNALLSRSIAGVIGKTLIYTLPGSVKAINDYMSEITKTFHHLVLMLNDIDSH